MIFLTKLYRILMTILSLSILFFSDPSVASADVLCKEGSPPEIKGEITKGDFLNLLKCLDSFAKKGRPQSEPTEDGKYNLKPIGWVYFDSEGGDVNEAIKIGRFLRESLSEVVVQDKCCSACFMAIVGAVIVYAGEPFGEVGLHRIFYDKNALGQTDMGEYEAFYNKLKKGAREYFYEMDVPTSIVEKVFSISSSDIYFLKESELKFLNSHPAYDEWIKAKCPNSLSKGEQEDYSKYVSSGFRKGSFSDGYIEYLKRRNSDFELCVETVRWDQFKKTISKYFDKAN